MSIKLDIKSALLGLGAGILVTLSIAAASFPVSHPVGRFQIAGTSDRGLLLDTTTGKIWSGYFGSAVGRMDADFFESKVDEKK
jgi:hypothetical protein